jgi:putative ABC transport system permease protein
MNTFKQIQLSLRQLFNKKAFATINLLSFITGICIAMMIGQFVWFEFSFENFNPHADEVYRINLYNTENGVFTNVSDETVSGLAYEMKESIPGICSIARVSKASGIVTNKENQISDVEASMVYGEKGIIDLLAIDMLHAGNDVLKEGSKSVVISESAALRYFGKTDVIGDVLDFGFRSNSVSTTPYHVQGVFKDIPQNSNLRFDFILAVENVSEWDKNWDWSNVNTYAQFDENVKQSAIDAGFENIVKKHHRLDSKDRYLLEPISDIRLRAANGTGRYYLVKVFILFGAVILVLAWCNYINLSTANFVDSVKEMGVKKLLGATRNELIGQLLLNTLVFNLISFVVAAVIFLTTWSWVAEFIECSPRITLFDQPVTLVICLAFVGVSTVISGLYPSIFLSSFKPLQSVKGSVSSLVNRQGFRKILVTMQLTISIVLITAIFAINKQLLFMKEQNLGISLDQTMVIREAVMTDNTSIHQYQPFKNEILKMPGVKAVTFASSYPGGEIDWHRADVTLSGNKDIIYDSRIVSIGTEFLDFFSIPLLTGRNFNPDILYENKSILLNEEACKMFKFLPYEKAIGQTISVGSRTFEVIGVIKNYHFQSLQFPLAPILFMHGYPLAPSYAIKFEPQALQGLLPQIEKVWKASYAGNIFKYEFLLDSFEKQYQTEQVVGRVIGLLTFFGILISCSGLFGLSLYAVGQKTKQIAIRKVLGASEKKIVLYLWRDYMLLLLIACLGGVTIVYFLVNRWLDTYAYKMSLTVAFFFIPIVIISVLTLLTIGFQTIAAARRNPSTVLKYE